MKLALTNKNAKKLYSPQCNAQPPDSLHLEADRLRRADKIAVGDPAALVQQVAQMSGKGIRGRVAAGQIPEDVAVQIRKRLADEDGDYDERNQHEKVHHRAGNERQDVVDEEDEGEDAVENDDAGLATGDSTESEHVLI